MRTVASILFAKAMAVASITVLGACNQTHPDAGLYFPTDYLITSPTVASVTPADGATAVSAATAVTVVFSKNMNVSTLTTNTEDTQCTGSIQLSSNDFASCVRLNAISASASGASFSLQPTTTLPTTTYKVRVTTQAKDTVGNSLSSAYDMVTGFRPQLTFVGASPGDGASGTGTTSSIAVTFSGAADVSSVTVNTVDNTCAGYSVRVYDTIAMNCAQITAAPTVTNQDTTFAFTPLGGLAASRLHQLIVTTDVKDPLGVPILAAHSGTFTTGAAPDGTAPTVLSTAPAAAATNVALGTTISVTFDEPMNPGTLTTNTADTTCSGSFQVSNDGFATCVRMTAAPVVSGGGATFTITPFANLLASNQYQVRITTAAMDLAGNALAVQFTAANFFTTGKLVFVTASSYTGGGLGGVTGGGSADAKCGTDTNYPGTGTYKALISLGTTRRACSSNNCTTSGAAENIDWPLAPNMGYYRLNGTTRILTTNAAGIHIFAASGGSNLNASIGTGSSDFWSGLSATWTNSGSHCGSWNNVLANGTQGSENRVDDRAITSGGGLLSCLGSAKLVCVQQ